MSGTAAAVKGLAAELAAITTRPWTLMEVCGGQTHAIVRWGLDQLLPEGVRLIHGPGCPVCVTPAATIEQALRLALRSDVILCSYGDMLRVPGEGRDTLLSVRAAGGDVRLLTTPQQALQLARSHPDRQVVFLAVGFETTAPATALLARQALALGIGNLTLLNAHVRVSPAMEAILAAPANQVQGFLAAGHVCSVLGTGELDELGARWRVPVVVTGFAPQELMAGVLAGVRQLEAGEGRVENAYGSVVRSGGNPTARRLLDEVFEPCDRPWRGLGVLAGGGLMLRGPYRALDAALRFGLAEQGSGVSTAAQALLGGAAPPATAAATTDDGHAAEPAAEPTLAAGCTPCAITASGAQSSPAQPRTAARGDLHVAADSPRPPAREPCMAGAILRGLATPPQCQFFGTTCTPLQPLGAPMVSSEGACAAYFLYRLRSPEAPHHGEGGG